MGMRTRDFIRALKKTRRDYLWFIDGDNLIRATTDCGSESGHMRSLVLCPITAVVLLRTGQRYGDWAAGQAAHTIGLSAPVCSAVIAASDNRGQSELRAELIKAIGLCKGHNLNPKHVKATRDAST